MDVDIELYPEQIRDQLEDAIRTSVDNYVNKEIREENLECPECEGTNLDSKVESDGNGNYNETAECTDCGESIEVEVQVSDLASGF